MGLLTEPLAVLLVSALSYCVVRSIRGDSRLFAVLAGLFFGYLSLSKVIFGYVLFVSLGVSALFFWKRTEVRKMLLACAVALVCCAPYLAYTHAVTGRPLYWSNAGGLSLYWMSTPHAGE